MSKVCATESAGLARKDGVCSVSFFVYEMPIPGGISAAGCFCSISVGACDACGAGFTSR